MSKIVFNPFESNSVILPIHAFLLFIRKMFEHEGSGYKYSDDDELSQIAIEVNYAAREEIINKKPLISIAAGPALWSNASIENRGPGNNPALMGDVVNGKIIVSVYSQVAQEAYGLAFLISFWVNAFKDVFYKYFEFLKISSMSISPPMVIGKGSEYWYSSADFAYSININWFKVHLDEKYWDGCLKIMLTLQGDGEQCDI